MSIKRCCFLLCVGLPVGLLPGSVEAQEAARAAKAEVAPAAAARVAPNQGLLARPVSEVAEAWLLLGQMRGASAELQTILEQNLRGLRLSPRERAGQAEGLAHIRTMKDDLDRAIAKWEQKLASIGDDAQLSNIDLQNMLQMQQQTLQTLSNVSKMMHDTAMAIIRKIG